MGLVWRRGRPYLYRSFRENGRVYCRYVCSGDLARIEADEIECQRYERQAQRERLSRVWRDARDRLDGAEGRLVAWYAAVEDFFRGAMAAAGCYQHKRQWRRRRMNAEQRSVAEKRLSEFFERAAAGDPSEYAVVKVMFDAAPDSLIGAYGGDLAARVVSELTDRVVGVSLFRREAVARKLAGVRADLEGPDPSPLERVLAERAAVCWLAAYEADLVCLKGGDIAEAEQADYFGRRRDRAHRRFLQAVKALAGVRRLAVSAREVERKLVSSNSSVQ